jgi:membrane fusion protein (multidrug efflux system)
MTQIVKKRMTIMVTALIVVFGGIIAFNLIKSIMIQRFLSHMPTPTVSVSSVNAIERDWIPRIAAVGNFVAINGVDVNSQIGGNVTAIHFNSGQYVEKDQPLIDIDDRVEQATLQFNEADLSLQTINFKRQQDLFKRNATPKSSVDEAQAKMLEAQANVDKTKALIQQKHITAPFSGKAGIRQINLGQYITPGQTAIVTLQSVDPLFIDFYLPEQLLGRLKLNQGILFSVEQNPGLQFKGTITAINSKIDTNTHTIQVQAMLPNCPQTALKDPAHTTLIKIKDHIVYCDSQLNKKNHVEQFNFVPGMFASIAVVEPKIHNAVVLPSTAISYSLYGNSVFVIEKDNNPSDTQKELLHVKRVFVSVGEQLGNDTVITKGIHAGQQVVSSGELKLNDGTPVTINNKVTLKPIAPNQLGQ